MAQKLQILFEDTNLRVIEKPPCLHTTSNKDPSSDSLERLLKQSFPKEQFVQSDQFEAGIVHRLDYETSGVLLAAKNEATWEYLRSLFKEGKISKKYLALVERKAPENQTLNHWIGGRYRHSKKVTVYEESIGRSQPAKAILKRLSFDEKNNFSKIEIDLITGVRHQIRAQCAFVGHVLVGDELYGSLKRCPIAQRPFFLHSWKTIFIDQQGVQRSFEANIVDK